MTKRKRQRPIHRSTTSATVVPDDLDWDQLGFKWLVGFALGLLLLIAGLMAWIGAYWISAVVMVTGVALLAIRQRDQLRDFWRAWRDRGSG